MFTRMSSSVKVIKIMFRLLLYNISAENTKHYSIRMTLSLVKLLLWTKFFEESRGWSLGNLHNRMGTMQIKYSFFRRWHLILEGFSPIEGYLILAYFDEETISKVRERADWPIFKSKLFRPRPEVSNARYH